MLSMLQVIPRYGRVFKGHVNNLAEAQLAAFAEKWGEAYPPIGQSWQRD